MIQYDEEIENDRKGGFIEEEYPSDYEDDLEKAIDGPLNMDDIQFKGKEDIDFKFENNTDEKLINDDYSYNNDDNFEFEEVNIE